MGIGRLESPLPVPVLKPLVLLFPFGAENEKPKLTNITFSDGDHIPLPLPSAGLGGRVMLWGRTNLPAHVSISGRLYFQYRSVQLSIFRIRPIIAGTTESDTFAEGTPHPPDVL